MDRDKQIEEMVVENLVAFLWHNTNMYDEDLIFEVAKALVNAGYRKISDDHQRQCTCYALGCQMAAGLKKDVAREIFEEIEKAHEECIHIDPSTNIGYLLRTKFELKLAELKKKYIGEDTNVTTNTEEGK